MESKLQNSDTELSFKLTYTENTYIFPAGNAISIFFFISYLLLHNHNNNAVILISSSYSNNLYIKNGELREYVGQFYHINMEHYRAPLVAKVLRPVMSDIYIYIIYPRDINGVTTYVSNARHG